MSDQKPDFRLDHTMIRVFDQEKTLNFYTRILGMKILRQNEYPEGRFTNTFIGYQGEDEGTTIEMTYNWDREEPYDMGNAWGHLALKVSDVYAICGLPEVAGCRIRARARTDESWHPRHRLLQGPERLCHRVERAYRLIPSAR